MLDVYVDQIMTGDLITVHRSQTLVDAGVVMTESGIKSVVVCDTDNRPVGILTSTDFVQMAADGGTPMEGTVEEYMTQDIVTTTPDTVAHEAAEMMIEHTISHLPVVSEDGKLTGIVTTTDVAAYVSSASDLVRE